MASRNDTRVCRLCRALVPSKRAVSLFTTIGVQQQWSKRIESLLRVPVASSDGLSGYICEKCKLRIVSHEKAAADLQEFKETARCSIPALERVRGPLKRTKSTSSQLGVSPDTARERPRCKLSRKRLDFDSPKSSGPSQGTGTGSCPPSPLVVASPVPLSSVNSRGNITKDPPPRKSVTVTVSTPSRTPYTGALGEREGKVARQLLGGHAPSIAKAVMAMDSVRDELFHIFLDAINTECNNLCQRSPANRSLFRKIPVSQFINFKWSELVSELEARAPLLLRALSTIVSRNDQRNQSKVGAAHSPGICMAAAVVLKERNREMCGVQSLISLLMYSCHCEKQVYERLNHVNVCTSYKATLSLMDEVSNMHTIPLAKWIADGEVVKFWGDNVNKKQKPRDVRSDHHGEMLNMYSVLAGKSRTPGPQLSHVGHVSSVSDVTPEMILPTTEDIAAVKSNLVVLVSRVLTQYLSGPAPLSKAIAKHITHKYTAEMSKKSEVVVMDVLMKNETVHADMISIMKTMLEYLGTDYDDSRSVVSGGDLLTCERQQGAQKHMMCGNTPRERLDILKPVTEDWHSLVNLLGAMWKTLYKNSASNHGTLMFFRNKLNRTTLSNDPKKQVDATIDFVYTVVKGHWIACACEILGITDVDGTIDYPRGLLKEDLEKKREFVEGIARQVVNRLTLVESAFVRPGELADSGDTRYNYARVLCHFGSLVMECRDAWAEGDGERVIRCWRLFLPHFQVAGHTKYSLAAFNVQLQTKATLSPNAAHQVMWHRFVNSKGGIGKNIPCDLYNEHINRLVKYIIQNMGPNLTEASLQRAARSVSTLHSICQTFDKQSGVPHGTVAHSTRPDRVDVLKVVGTVMQHQLLTPVPGRKHTSFPKLHLDPLHKWDIKKARTWIERKKVEYLKYQRCDNDEEDDHEGSGDFDIGHECEEL